MTKNKRNKVLKINTDFDNAMMLLSGKVPSAKNMEKIYLDKRNPNGPKFLFQNTFMENGKERVLLLILDETGEFESGDHTIEFIEDFKTNYFLFPK